MAKKVDIVKDFEMICTLGKGSFGRVKSAKYKEDGKIYAVKFMKKEQIMNLKQVDHINHEKELMQQFKHPFLVNMMGYSQDPQYIFIIMEVVSGGELFQHLRAIYKFTEEQAKFYGLITAAAFSHIHARNVIHRDLKPENLLICFNGYAKLTDFGFAKEVEPGERTYTLCGTPEYIAPEVLLNQGHNKPFDWWTLGILIYEMQCGQAPFQDEDPLNIYHKILAGKMYFPRTMNKDAKHLIKKLNTQNLAKRYGNLKDGDKDVLNHPWFKSLDFAKLEKQSLTAPYKPDMKDEHDTSNFTEVPDSVEIPATIADADNPFTGW